MIRRKWRIFSCLSPAMLTNNELMYQDIIQKELKPEMADRYVFWLLDILSAYDEQKQKDPLLLGFAEKICEWLQAQGLTDGSSYEYCTWYMVQRLKKTSANLVYPKLV